MNTPSDVIRDLIDIEAGVERVSELLAAKDREIERLRARAEQADKFERLFEFVADHLKRCEFCECAILRHACEVVKAGHGWSEFIQQAVEFAKAARESDALLKPGEAL